MPIIRTKFDKQKLLEVDNIFDESAHQADVVDALYAMVIPDYERVTKIEGWPKAGEQIQRYLFDKFYTFDRKHHPEVMKGGRWMNCGFSTLDNESVDPWEVVVDTDILVYEGDAPCPSQPHDASRTCINQ